MKVVVCPSCGARLPDTEAASGWCETCGKRVPRYALSGTFDYPREGAAPAPEEAAVPPSPPAAQGPGPSAPAASVAAPAPPDPDAPAFVPGILFTDRRKGTITVGCECGQAFEADPSLLHRAARCRHCGAYILVAYPELGPPLKDPLRTLRRILRGF